jgi:hypothetical protein
MDGLLNEATNTVHRQSLNERKLHSTCGVTYNVPKDHLRQVAIEREVTATTTSKCGRCFEDGGGY